MKSTLIIAALVFTAQAIELSSSGFTTIEKKGDTKSHDIWNNDWNKYSASRKKGNDCDVREAENWLGSGKCKYSWECRGARMCEGNGWCLGNDACDEMNGRK